MVRDGKTVEILFDSFWADGGRDNLQPDPRGEVRSSRFALLFLSLFLKLNFSLCFSVHFPLFLLFLKLDFPENVSLFAGDDSAHNGESSW